MINISCLVSFLMVNFLIKYVQICNEILTLINTSTDCSDKRVYNSGENQSTLRAGYHGKGIKNIIAIH